MTPEPPRAATSGSEPGPRPPRALDVVLAGVAVEAAALGAGVVWAVVDLVRGRSDSPGASVVLALFLVLVGAGVLAAARALRRGARRARGLVVTWQLLQAASAATLLGAADAPAGAWWGGVSAVVLAVVVLVAALSPSALRFTAEAEADTAP